MYIHSILSRTMASESVKHWVSGDAGEAGFCQDVIEIMKRRGEGHDDNGGFGDCLCTACLTFRLHFACADHSFFCPSTGR